MGRSGESSDMLIRNEALGRLGVNRQSELLHPAPSLCVLESSDPKSALWGNSFSLLSSSCPPLSVTCFCLCRKDDGRR